MMDIKQRKSVYQLAASLVLSGLLAGAHAETAAELHLDAQEALQLLYSTNEVAANVSTTSIQDDAYAFIFNQQGLMAGVSVEGTKISHIVP